MNNRGRRVKNKEQGKFVTVYLPAHLLDKWKNIKEKSKFVQEALENA